MLSLVWMIFWGYLKQITGALIVPISTFQGSKLVFGALFTDYI